MSEALCITPQIDDLCADVDRIATGHIWAALAVAWRAGNRLPQEPSAGVHLAPK